MDCGFEDKVSSCNIIFDPNINVNDYAVINFENSYNFNGAVTLPSVISTCNNMFANCTSLDSYINTPGIFDLGIIFDTRYMFYSCIAFNKPVTMLEDISYDAGNRQAEVVRMHRMFDNCQSYNQPVSLNIASGKGIDISYMYNNCISLNKEIDINLKSEGLESFQQITMSSMFNRCTALDKPVTINITANSNTEVLAFGVFNNCSVFDSAMNITINGGDNTDIRLGSVIDNCSLFNNSISITVSGEHVVLESVVKQLGSFNKPISLNIAATNDVSLQFLYGYCPSFNCDVDLNNISAYELRLGGMLEGTSFDRDLYIPYCVQDYSVPFDKGSNNINALTTYTHTISLPRHHDRNLYNGVVPEYTLDSGIHPYASTVGATVVYRDGAPSGTVIPYYSVNTGNLAGYTWDTYFQYFNHEEYYR